MNARNEALADAVQAPSAVEPQATPRYRIVPIGTRAFGHLNERGQVAFNESLGEGRFAAKFYDGRRVRMLGTLGGVSALTTALNNFEQVTGWSNFDMGERVHAYRWSPTTGMIDLGTTRGGDESEGTDINNMGEVAGLVRFSDNRPERGVVWRQNDRPLDLGLNNGVFSPLFINDQGQVAGTAIDREGRAQVFRWTRTGRAVFVDDPRVVDSEFRGLNEAGQITGVHSNTDGAGLLPFLWTPGQEFLPLFDRPAFPFALNESGVVVGVLLDQVAFVWTRAEGLTVLGAFPGGSFSNAYDVNNHGVVVGQAATADSLHGFLWTRTGGLVDLNDRLVGPMPGFVVGLAFEINDQGSILAATNDGNLILLVPFPG
jgi:probable HAF family extracellular repeat protein